MQKDKKNKILKIVLIMACFLTLLPTITKAGEIGDYTLLEPLPYMGVADDEGNLAPVLGDYLVGMFKLLIAVAGVLAVIMITIGGVQYMTTEAISGKDEGKKKIQAAVFGLVLALSSYLLLNEIDPNLVTTTMTLIDVPGPVNVEWPEIWSGTCDCYKLNWGPIVSSTKVKGSSKDDCGIRCQTWCKAGLSTIFWKSSIDCKKETDTPPVTEVWGGECICYDTEPTNPIKTTTVRESSGRDCGLKCAGICEPIAEHFDIDCAKI